MKLKQLVFLSSFLLIYQTLYGQQVINPSDYKHPVRVACIGASITYGAGIADVPRDAYPAQLGRILGEHWDVRNFGVNSTGILKTSDYPYWNTEAFKKALAFLPDVVLIKLGTNDSKPQNWKYKNRFYRDYREMIDTLRGLPSHPRIYLCLPLPVYRDHWGIREKVVKNELIPMEKKLARKAHLSLIDLYKPLEGHPASFKRDGVHLDKAGAGLMALTVAKALTGKTATLIPASYPGKRSEWHGFDRYDFQFEWRDARIVVPHHALANHYWVWRARFPDWHYEMDSILLSKGFYIVYLNTDNMFGSPGAIACWNDFYHYLESNYGMNKKVALEGVSRGGLFIYRFAKKYPQRTACIYAEAPVCDIRSWPGGMGKSPGDSASWKILLKEYHLTEEAAMHYKDNPFDSLQKIAKYKIPIWHSIGLHDSLAPPKENTFILVKRYIKLGGPATIYPNTEGKTSLHGHHFRIEEPGAGADFIQYNCMKNRNY